MKYEEFVGIAALVDNIKQTDIYETYLQAYRTLQGDEQALALLDAYHEVQEQYAESVVEGRHDQNQKAKLKQAFLMKKLELNKNDVINNHLRMQRTIEFFVDDLNYEINQMLGKKPKKQCGTHRKQNKVEGLK